MVGRVVVVTEDKQVAAEFRELGCETVAEKRNGAGDTLNDAIERGRAWALRNCPHEPIAVLPADMPSLTAEVLDDVLVLTQRHDLAFCVDAESTGTTIFAAASPRILVTAYGEFSADRHREFGAVPIGGIDLRARRDVDTVEDLVHARVLGLGSRTEAVLRKFSFDPSTNPCDAAPR